MAWTNTNWQTESVKAAAYAAENNVLEGPVGVMRWGPPGTVALYGHAGETRHERNRSVQCAGVLRSLLANAGVEVLAAGVDNDGRAWSILAESDSLDLLDAIVLEAWQIAGCMRT